MRAREFIIKEDIPANAKNMPSDQDEAIKGLVSIPDISMNNSSGSAYKQYRFGIAMAGAPDYPTPPVGAMAGDPMLTTYSDADFEIIKSAAKMVDAGNVNQVTRNKSKEADDVHHVSPVPNWNPGTPKTKKKKKKNETN